MPIPVRGPSTIWLASVLLLAALPGCAGGDAPEPSETTSSLDAPSDLRVGLGEALTFHASFDNGVDADWAVGDAQLYTSLSYDEQEQAVPGIGNPAVSVVEGAGRFGSALRFDERNQHAIFYRAKDNVAYSSENWSGTVSFWLSLDPETDLEPGFCDPIQITDAAYNDAALWVDFTAEHPRQFRLGVFGDLDVWNPDGLAPDMNAAFTERLLVVDDPPFAAQRWTHVVMTYEGLNTEEGGVARLYLDGEPLAHRVQGISEPFTWDLEQGAIRLGVNYVGLYDDVSAFDRALSAAEVHLLHGLESGVAALHR